MPQEANGRNISRHILTASSNLLGLCFILIHFLKFWKIGGKINVVVDKSVAVSMLFFLAASILSYVSMRSEGQKSAYYERVADLVFLFGLVFIAVISILVSFEIL